MIEVTSRRMECTLLTPDFSQVPAVALQDDGEEVVTKVSKALNVELNPELDIQRVHRLGKKKKGPKAKPRPVIVRFASYKKRMEFMYKNQN